MDDYLIQIEQNPAPLTSMMPLFVKVFVTVIYNTGDSKLLAEIRRRGEQMAGGQSGRDDEIVRDLDNITDLKYLDV